MKKAVIFDIDGVLAEKSPERDYREYDKVHLDKPIKLLFNLLEYYYDCQQYTIIFITERKVLCQDLTKKWIVKYFNKNADLYKVLCQDLTRKSIVKYFNKNADLYRINNFDDNFNLFMRQDNDHRKAYILKKELYETYIEGKYDVIACYDDDPEIIKMYQEKGLMTFLVGNRK